MEPTTGESGPKPEVSPSRTTLLVLNIFSFLSAAATGIVLIGSSVLFLDSPGAIDQVSIAAAFSVLYMVATIISIVLSYKKNSRSLAAWPIGAFLLILALLFVGMPVALNIINAFSPARSTQIQITTIEAPRRQDPFFADIYKALPDLDPSYSLEKFSVPSGSEIIYVKSFIEGSEVSLGHVYGFNLRTKTISNMPVLNQYLMSWADAWYKTLSSDGLKYVSIEHRDPNSQTAPLYNKIFLVNLRTDSVKTLYTLTPGQTFNGLGVNSPYGDYNCPIPQWRKDNHTIFYTVYKDSGVPTSDCRPILGKGELVVP